MTPTQIARRSDALYADGTCGMTRRVLCDMVAQKESDLEDARAENAKLRELVRDMSSLADQACDAMPTCYKCPILGAETCDLTDAFQRMRELGVEVE